MNYSPVFEPTLRFRSGVVYNHNVYSLYEQFMQYAHIIERAMIAVANVTIPKYPPDYKTPDVRSEQDLHAIIADYYKRDRAALADPWLQTFKKVLPAWMEYFGGTTHSFESKLQTLYCPITESDRTEPVYQSHMYERLQDIPWSVDCDMNFAWSIIQQDGKLVSTMILDAAIKLQTKVGATISLTDDEWPILFDEAYATYFSAWTAFTQPTPFLMSPEPTFVSRKVVRAVATKMFKIFIIDAFNQLKIMPSLCVPYKLEYVDPSIRHMYKLTRVALNIDTIFAMVNQKRLFTKTEDGYSQCDFTSLCSGLVSPCGQRDVFLLSTANVVQAMNNDSVHAQLFTTIPTSVYAE